MHPGGVSCRRSLPDTAFTQPGTPESTALARLRDAHPDVGSILACTQRFGAFVRERRGSTEREEWLVEAEASEVREVRQFAHKVRRDEAAVRAGCTLEWSNEQTVGKITKLKAIKRQMYGRAKFDLLRLRALYAARERLRRC